jgi:hypothetical protein
MVVMTEQSSCIQRLDEINVSSSTPHLGEVFPVSLPPIIYFVDNCEYC